MPLQNYRKKPVVIQAVRFDPFGEHAHQLPEGVLGPTTGDAKNWAEQGCEFRIDTLEGPHIVSPGDYIITGVKGERYACKPDIFEMTYDLVEP